MNFPVDLALFDQTAHSPSLLSLERSMRRDDLRLRDYCIPVNPYFPTPRMFAQFREQLETALKYYPSPSHEIGQVLGQTLGLPPESLVLANGSTELITWIDQLWVRRDLATPVPTFGRWTDHPRELGRRVHAFPLLAEQGFRLDVGPFVDFVRRAQASVVVVCNPNNPTGSLLEIQETMELVQVFADLDLIVIDESFIDFADLDQIPSFTRLAPEQSNVLVLKSLGKNFGLHGMRAGYAVGNPKLAARLRTALQHWNVNGVVEMLIRQLADHFAEYELSRRQVVCDRIYLEQQLRTLDAWDVFPSRANFVYARLADAISGAALRDRLLTEFGILVRQCGNKQGADCRSFRIAARPREQVDELLPALRQVSRTLQPRQPGPWTNSTMGQHAACD